MENVDVNKFVLRQKFDLNHGIIIIFSTYAINLFYVLVICMVVS